MVTLRLSSFRNLVDCLIMVIMLQNARNWVSSREPLDTPLNDYGDDAPLVSSGRVLTRGNKAAVQCYALQMGY